MTRPLATQHTENCPFFSGAPGKCSRGAWELEKAVQFELQNSVREGTLVGEA